MRARDADGAGSMVDAQNRRAARRAVSACLLVLFFLPVFAGCGGPMSYVHPTADLSYIKTVAIVPLMDLSGQKGAEGKVMNVVAIELLRRGVDVVEFGEVSKVLKSEGYGREPGVISKSMAENAGKRLNIQGFIVGSVQEYGASTGRGAYPEVSVSLKLIDAKSYAILWEATHSVKGTTILDRLFGIGKKSTSDLCQEVVVELLDTLFEG